MKKIFFTAVLFSWCFQGHSQTVKILSFPSFSLFCGKSNAAALSRSRNRVMSEHLLSRRGRTNTFIYFLLSSVYFSHLGLSPCLKLNVSFLRLTCNWRSPLAFPVPHSLSLNLNIAQNIPGKRERQPLSGKCFPLSLDKLFRMLNTKTFQGKESLHKIVSNSALVSERVNDLEFQCSNIYHYPMFISKL